MSEIVKHSRYGEMKLGTCENLYYITYDQLRQELPNLTRINGNLTPEEYLNPRYGFRYRFPFPDESDFWQAHNDFDRGFQIVIPRSLFQSGAIEILHKQIFIRNGHPANFPFGLQIPCPATEEESGEVEYFDYHGIRKHLIFEFVQQTIVGNQLTTIVRCPFCNLRSVLAKEEVELIHHIVFTQTNRYDDLTKQIVDIALAGYNRV